MSNTRRIRAQAGQRDSRGPACGSCGHRIRAGRDHVVLKDGRRICARCRDTGMLMKRLPCGHNATPGSFIITDSADGSNFQCLLCSPHSAVRRLCWWQHVSCPRPGRSRAL